MRLKLEDLPEDCIDKYKLRDKVTKDGYVYVNICKGMYEFPQSGILAQELLVKQLNLKDRQGKLTPGFWTHGWHPISFSLVVDDSGVKYVDKNMSDTSCWPSRKTTPSHMIGKESGISDSPSIGTMKTK